MTHKCENCGDMVGQGHDKNRCMKGHQALNRHLSSPTNIDGHWFTRISNGSTQMYLESGAQPNNKMIGSEAIIKNIDSSMKMLQEYKRKILSGN